MVERPDFPVCSPVCSKDNRGNKPSPFVLLEEAGVELADREEDEEDRQPSKNAAVQGSLRVARSLHEFLFFSRLPLFDDGTGGSVFTGRFSAPRPLRCVQCPPAAVAARPRSRIACSSSRIRAASSNSRLAACLYICCSILRRWVARALGDSAA